MSIQALIIDDNYKKSISSISGIEHLKCHFVASIEELLEKSVEHWPRIFIIQENADSPLRIMDLIRDLRMLFGAAPTIMLVGEVMSGKKLTRYLGIGCDNFFQYPFDSALVEDFLYKSTKKELCKPFKYRHVPSGEVPIEVKMKLFITEVNLNGVHFETHNLIANGVIFPLDLNPLLDLYPYQVKVRVLHSEFNENGSLSFFAEYHELDPDLRKRIAFKLKAS